MQQLSIRKQMEDGVLILTLKGQLDALTTDALLAEMSVLSESPSKLIVLDLKEISLVDSSGIGAIVSILKKTRAMSGDTALANVDSQPMQVFKIVNLHKAIKMLGSVDAAVSYLKAASTISPNQSDG